MKGDDEYLHSLPSFVVSLHSLDPSLHRTGTSVVLEFTATPSTGTYFVALLTHTASSSRVEIERGRAGAFILDAVRIRCQTPNWVWGFSSQGVSRQCVFAPMAESNWGGQRKVLLGGQRMKGDDE